MTFAVLGTGGVGGYFGALLARSGVPVTFVARGGHLAAIRARGLEVRGPNESFVVHPANATDDLASVGAVDVVLVAVKTWQLPALASALRPIIGPATAVVPLLNGVDAPAQLASAIGAERVLGGLCNIMSYVAGPGVIEHLGAAASITFGELSRVISPRVEAIRDAMARAGITAVVPADVTAAMWKKLAFIASLGGVGAVSRAPTGVVRGVGETRAMLERAIAEVIALAQARGVGIGDEEIAKTMAYVDTIPPDGFASMARDLMAGRRSELDALSGAVARKGREARVPTPVHDLLYASLLPTELRARGELAT